jgi:predicted nucleotidyltransferase
MIKYKCSLYDDPIYIYLREEYRLTLLRILNIAYLSQIMFESLIKDLSQHNDVVAILLGGSRATHHHDTISDYDVYVYTSKPIDENIRKSIIAPYVSYMEYSNNFWELEDDGTLNNGIDIEFIYRDINHIEVNLINTVDGNISNGYSTCILDNFMNSKIIFEKDQVITKIRNKIIHMDWTPMFDKIVIENMKLLRDLMPSIYYQIEKAIKRHDIISINHRLTAYFSIAFDVLFALNKTLHPGEKRLLELIKTLVILPKDFEHLVNDVFKIAFIDSKKSLESLDILTTNIYDLVLEQGYSITKYSFENKDK